MRRISCLVAMLLSVSSALIADEPSSLNSQPLNTWVKRSPLPDGAFSPRLGYEGACVWDSRHQLLVRYGGHNQGGGGEQGAEVWYSVERNEWRDMKPETMPPTNQNDAVLTYDPINHVVLAIVKITTGEGEDAEHEVQTWAYDAGTNKWTRMKPATEPDAAGNRTRNLIFAPELNLAILENCTGRPREQQIWTYRYADAQETYAPSNPKQRRTPAIVEDVVASVISANRVEVAWSGPIDAMNAGYLVKRAVVEVWSDDQLVRLKRNTAPLASTSVGAIRRIGPFAKLTEKPVRAMSFVDDTVDLKKPLSVKGEPTLDRQLHAEHLDRSGRDYPFAVFAYRVRAVDGFGNVSGLSPAVFTIPSSPQQVFSREDGMACQLKWTANPEKGITGYRIYRLDGRWNKDPVSRLTPDPISVTTYRDGTAGKSTRRYYIVAVDALGQEGFPSSPVWFQREWQAYYAPFVGDWHQ